MPLTTHNAMKLTELNGTTPQTEQDNAVRALVMQTMMAEAPILNYAQFYKFTGSADNVRKAANATMGRNRSINQDYPQNLTAPMWQTLVLKIFGDRIQTDIAYQRRGTDIGSEHTRELTSAARSIAREFVDQLFNGDMSSNSEQMDGLAVLTPPSRTVHFDNDVPLGATSNDIAKKNAFIEAMDKLTLSVKGGAQLLVMNEYVIARLRSLGRDFVQTSTVQDALGNPQMLTSYTGIPIVNAGYRKAGSGLVIGNTETVGTNNDGTSIYALRFGEAEDVTIGTNTGLWVDTERTNIFVETRVELDAGLGILDDRSIARMSGIRIV